MSSCRDVQFSGNTSSKLQQDIRIKLKTSKTDHPISRNSHPLAAQINQTLVQKGRTYKTKADILHLLPS